MNTVLRVRAVAAGPSSHARRVAMATLAAAPALALLLSLTPQVGAQTGASGFVYTADEHGSSVSRIDLASGKVDVVPIAVAPHNVQFVPRKDRILAVGTPVQLDSSNGHEAEDSGDSHGGGAMVTRMREEPWSSWTRAGWPRIPQ